MRTLATMVAGRLSGDAEVAVLDASADSRQIGPGWLFIAVPGASFDGRRMRPAEGVEHAIACVSLGLELLGAEPASPGAARLLERYPCDGLFRLAVLRARERHLELGRQIRPESVKWVRGLLKGLKV